MGRGKSKNEREEIMQDHREPIKNVLFMSKEIKKKYKGVSFLVEAELHEIDDEVICPKVIGVKGGKDIYEFVFHEFEVPDTRIEIPFPFRGINEYQDAFDHFYDLIQQHWTKLLAEQARLTIAEDEACLEVGDYQSIDDDINDEVGEPDGMEELRETFKDCALTEDEAEALGFGPGPHFPEPEY